MRWKLLTLVLAIALAAPVLALAQQTGVISGKVIGTDNLVIPGVTVDARSAMLPGPRVTVTGSNGDYRLQALPPGDYTVAFELSGMAKVTKQVQVQLNQDTTVNVTMSVGGVTETVEVKGEIVPVIEKDSASIRSGVSASTIQSLPVGQEYRDLLKLIPGVALTQDSIRGPSSGGSGQDNVYKFDGVNVTLPLFGTLSTEPASYDIQEVTTVKGGAKAVDFERSAGFSVDSISKSGSSRFSGQINFQLQSNSMAAKLASGTLSKYNQDRNWLTAGIGGPVINNKLFFYGSYYRPEVTRQNVANVYGSLPDYSSVRNEGFGKLTLTPLNNVLINGSYRYSHTLATGRGFGSTASNTAGVGDESWQRIGTADGSWVITSRSFVSFKYTNFQNPGRSRPDNLTDVAISTNAGTVLDINNLDKIGYFTVPTPNSSNPTYSAFVQPLIDRYGYTSNGVKTGGGNVGYYPQIDQDDFYRTQWQLAYNLTLGSTVTHDLHVGYQRYTDWENLKRSSNGWGTITVPGGQSPSIGINGIPAYYMAAFQQQTIGVVPTIHSVYKSQSFEFNDTIRVTNFTLNLGVLASNDKLYGQGLKNTPGTLSGFTALAGNQYKQYEIPFRKMIQPRMSATWAYNGKDTIYASFANYTPAASSLPRAASWARNLATTINAYFDANGVLYGTSPVASSSGKLFVPNMTPRTTTEYLLGTSKQVTSSLSAKAYFRYRYSSHFWEDTNNNARLVYAMPAGWGPAALYIPTLSDQLAQIGSGSSYVIAELDRAYTKYYEATLEGEWRSSTAYVRGSYTWSRYYGNFDQDSSTTTTSNDSNIFIGSSNIGDGVGHQLWNFKTGILHGDRTHSLKLYGYYQLPWKGSIGAYALAQSGQPWETWNYVPYLALSTSTSETIKYSEPSGSHRSKPWYQLDLNYTQSVPIKGRLKVQAVVDLYNVFNSQTGYNIEPRLHNPNYGNPTSWLSPRRLQLSARVQF